MTRLRCCRGIVRAAPFAVLCAALCAVLCAALLGPARGQEAPYVAALAPAHLAVDVDAGKVAQFVVTFDQDMDPALPTITGPAPTLPKVLRTRWRDARTCVVDVELQPERVYALDLAGSGFRSAQGRPLPPTPWLCATTGPPLPKGAAEQAADRLFAALRDQYSYRDRLGIDWAELERTARDGLLASPHQSALALRIDDLLRAAQDPHIAVRWRDCTLVPYQRQVAPNFDMRGLQKLLPKLQRIGRIGLAARTDDGIGYLFVATFAREQRDELEKVLEALRSLRDCKALVLDVRTNGGGDETLARRLAAFFVPGDKVYAAHRLRDPRGKDGFGERQDRFLRGNVEPDVFTNPVAVLMGPQNMSSAEAFLLMMKQAPKAVLVGAPSYGSSGNPQPVTLAASLTVMIPSWQALRPDGTCFEGEGIAPHIHVEATAEQLREGDPVLEEALQRLRGNR